ncbi:hypothetical protein JG688_00010772 [Phytophthora aleatoria]|uniref:Uncharacterized protein n=1 Tax=Phytophthora aleatoria TaxID=2496075 RepID=A0A8J5J591_9STRA|nr:hypothetical protein JG688_00010772 [Phytophthora aleatoria]
MVQLINIHDKLVLIISQKQTCISGKHTSKECLMKRDENRSTTQLVTKEANGQTLCPIMNRERIMHLSVNVHFSSNNDAGTSTDRAWKLRPIIDLFQIRFPAGYIPPQ